MQQMRDDMIEAVALAIEATMFADHEFPLGAELHAKYRETAAAAISAMDQWRFRIAFGYRSITGGPEIPYK
jgi:hypothetical protein